MDNQAETTVQASPFQPVKNDVSQRVNGEFKKIGEMVIYVPLLKDVMEYVATAKVKTETKDGKEVEVKDEDGIPVYVGDEANWVQSAIIAAVKAQARNKLQPKTATLKDGQKIPTTWAELCAEGTRGGEGLVIAREAKAAYAEFLAKSGMSEAAQATHNTLFSNKDALALQNAGTKEKVKARVMAFAESLDEAKTERFERPLMKVLEACDTALETANDF